MTPEERELLERTLEMAEANNKILSKMQSMNRLSMILRVSYWVIIILFSVGAYYFIQPYISTLTSIYGGNVDMNAAQNAANNLKDLLK